MSGNEKKMSIQVDFNGKEILDTLKTISEKLISIREVAESIFTKGISPSLSQMNTNIGAITPQLEQLITMSQKILGNNEELAKLSIETTELKLKNNEEEIKALIKTAKSIESINEIYKEKDNLLDEQRKKEKELIEEAYKIKVGLAATEGKDIENIETEKQERLTAIDTEYGDLRIKNMQDNMAATKALVEKDLKDIKERIYKESAGASEEEIKQKLSSVKGELAQLSIRYRSYSQDIAESYKELEKLYQKDSETFKQANQEKDKTLKVTAKTIQETTINQAELFRMSMEKMSKSVAEFSEKTALATSALSNMFKAQVASISSDIKDITQELSETTREKEQVDARVMELNENQSNLNEEEKKELSDKLELQKEMAKKENDLKNQKAKKEKELRKAQKLQEKADLVQSIIKATSDVAAGVAKTLAWGWPLGTIMAAVVGAAGAVQIGIMTKQLAKFEKGGLLNGKRHSEGGMRIEGTNIEVEGGEYVVNRRSTAKNLGLISYINSQDKELQAGDLSKFFAQRPVFMPAAMQRMMEEGGQIPLIEKPTGMDSEILDAIKAIDLQPRVAVTDIIRAQDQYASVENWSGV